MWDRASPAATAVAKPVVEARPQEIANDKALTETVCANAAATAVEEPAVEARPRGIAQHSATAVEGSSGPEQTTLPAPTMQQLQGLLVWSSTSGSTSTAGMAAVANSADEARPPGFAKHSATTESALARWCWIFWVQRRWHDLRCKSAQDLVPG